MKFSLNMLKNYLNLENISIEELQKLISLQMIEIESFQKITSASNLVIGRIIKCLPHPNSTHLHICEVDVKKEVLQIVCGAENARENLVVIVALIGAKLPGKDDSGLEIKKTEIRGIESYGMLCSYQELGIDEKYIPENSKNGIAELNSNLKIGNDALKELFFDDYSVDLGLTPNRNDLLSVLGIAYDLGAIINQKVNLRKCQLKETTKVNNFKVEIKSDKCLKYKCRIIENVKVKESPEWVKAYLMAANIRSINNIVDATNLIMLEFGQPFHAFDRELFGSEEIVVRNAKKDEKVITLDGISRTLLETDLVITNGIDIKALAGVMGGLDSGINENTKNIILEAAVFDSISIMRTSRRLGLISDASLRFERQIDGNKTEEALDFLTELIKELSPEGDILKNIAGITQKVNKPVLCELTLDFINDNLGINLTEKNVIDILTRLEFPVKKENELFKVTIPTRRLDILTRQDILEEIIRIHGYQSLNTNLPFFNSAKGLSHNQRFIRKIEDFLANNGLNQVYTYSLIENKAFNDFLTEAKEELILNKPLSADRTTMRFSLLHGLEAVLKHNSLRANENVNIFEISKVYAKDQEELRLGIILEGIMHQSKFQNLALKADFYLLKGLFVSLTREFGLTADFKAYSKENSNYHPFRTSEIYLENEYIGLIGEMHPSFLQDNNLNDHVFLEINLDKFLKAIKPFKKFLPLNKFPRITRDLSLVMPKEMPSAEIIKIFAEKGGKYLSDAYAFDEFLKISDTEKAIAYKLCFEDFNETLKSEKVEALIQDMLEALKLKKINLRK